MNEQERAQQIRNTFNTVAEGYDNPALRYFADSAALLPELFQLRGDERVLDVATGTGHAACALAPQVPRGQVVGVDFSAGMLEQARSKAAARNLHNTEFKCMDMQAMSFAPHTFDAANCSFGLFFVEDMDRLLAHIVTQVKSGGTIIACAFHEGAFLPLAEIFFTRIQSYGLQLPPLSWKRMGTEEKSAALFRRAGLVEVRASRRDLGYHLPDANAWWDIIWFAGFRGLVNQLAPEALTQFKREHLAEVQALATAEGIRLDVDIVFTRGVVPQQ